jgi:protein-S-isoprenylcysteine O-methyltransferase Ste14
MGTNEMTGAAAADPDATSPKLGPEPSPELSASDSKSPESTPARNDIRDLCKAPLRFVQSPRFRHALGNVCLALLFFTALMPTASPKYRSTIATEIWFWGAILMGVLSLVRVPPRSAMVNLRSILSTAAMMTIPVMMRPATATTGLVFDLAIVVEVIGMVFTQISRIYLGRRFGLLPANRGIVASGPFRLMRHPIYSGWLVLTIGFLIAYPTPRNFGMLILSLPFLVWRMDLEEEHLNADPEYREYAEKTPYRLVPGLY